MNSAIEHTLYLKFHPRLPHFVYRILATDKLTQLYATWRCAVVCSRSIPVRPSTIFKIHDFRRRVDDFHRRRFLRAFAKAHPLPRQKGSYWEFGSVKDIQQNLDSRSFAKSFAYQYKQARFWRQHIPNLP